MIYGGQVIDPTAHIYIYIYIYGDCLFYCRPNCQKTRLKLCLPNPLSPSHCTNPCVLLFPPPFPMSFSMSPAVSLSLSLSPSLFPGTISYIPRPFSSLRPFLVLVTSFPSPFFVWGGGRRFGVGGPSFGFSVGHGLARRR